MMLRKSITAGLSAAGILALILDSQTALSGANAGIELCLRTVIPSLFPFLFLCAVLSGALWGEKSRILCFIGRRTGIPQGAESVLVAAVLGGYPAGAQIIGTAYNEKMLSRNTAEHLLRFCSNAGPAFVFGIVAHQFDSQDTAWALMLIHILSAIIVGISHNRYENETALISIKSKNVSMTLNQTVKTIGIICGWIILFHILSEFLISWFFQRFSIWIQILLSGILELAGGCCRLSEIPSSSLRFVICSCFLAFGGVCVTMQTASVIGNLSMKQYLKGKGIQTIFSLVLSGLYLAFGWTVLILILITLLLFSKKTVDFPKKPMYNEPIISERTHMHAVS